MRRRVTVDDAALLRPHDHAAWFGNGDDELYAMAGTALAEGLRRNEKLVFVAEAPAVERLTALGDVERLVEQRQLEAVPIDAVYGAGTAIDANEQLSLFETVLVDARTAGFSGVRVVADNTRLVAGDGDRFDRWLAWERLADQLQARSQVTGICFFDSSALSEAQRADLAALHPVRSAGSAEPPFSLFADGDAVVLVGAVDSTSADQLRRLLTGVDRDRQPVLDVCAAYLIDDDALLALAEVASIGRPWQLRASGHLQERLATIGPAGRSLRIEGLSDAQPRCVRCGDVIGSYEQVVLVLPGGPRRTSLIAEPQLFADAAARYHGDCYTDT